MLYHVFVLVLSAFAELCWFHNNIHKQSNSNAHKSRCQIFVAFVMFDSHGAAPLLHTTNSQGTTAPHPKQHQRLQNPPNVEPMD